ncbi:MAG: helix-turn-helix transcriptional regulator [Bacteroidales bacterium]|nr:helix-turn-helix transcriptional regulator [Bacteroidales bacterium]
MNDMTRDYNAPRHSSDHPIAVARMKKGLTQRQLADIIGETQTKVSLWERGKFFPPMSAIMKIAKALDVDWTQLAEWQPEKQRSSIAVYRRKKGMTQGELAEALGVSQTYISYCECGVREPDINVLLKMAEILDTDIQSLMYAPPDAEKG